MLHLIKTSLLTTLLLALCATAETNAQEWSEGPPMGVARSDAAVAVVDGILYVIGGRNTTGQALDVVETFDPETGVWSTVASLRDERFSASAAQLSGQILLMGGRDDEEATDDVEVYDPEEDDWESFEDLDEERSGLASAVLQGRIYALGGASEAGAFLSTCEVYDPDEDEWFVFSTWTLTPGRASFGAVSADDAVYAVGGFSQFGPIDLVERFTLSNGTDVLEPLSSPRGRLALVDTDGALGGDLFAIGGEDGNGVLATVERYDIEQDAWASVAPLATARTGAVAAFLDGAIYVVGGEDAFGSALRSMEVYGMTTSDETSTTPAAFSLGAPFPNPFATRTTLSFEVADAGAVSLAVYDVQGRLVALLLDGVVAPGPHRLNWDGQAADGRPLPAGIYVVRLTGEAGIATAKLTLLR